MDYTTNLLFCDQPAFYSQQKKRKKKNINNLPPAVLTHFALDYLVVRQQPSVELENIPWEVVVDLGFSFNGYKP